METITNLTKKKALHILLIAGIMLLPIANFAQTKEQNEQKSQVQTFEQTLTKEQKELLQKERELMKQQREAFVKTLTEEQKQILRDNSKTQEQKREQLHATLSVQQKQMLEANEQRL